MIHISKPIIKFKGDEAFLSAEIIDDKLHQKSELWFSVERQFADGLCSDYADAFVLVMLCLAIHSHQDIDSDAPVSRKLLFNLRNTIIPLFAKALPDSKQIQIIAKGSEDFLYDSKAVGCGCSLGIDSMSSLLTHLQDNTTDGYKVTHLALFNSGQMGDYDLEKAEDYFKDTVSKLRPFSEDIGLPLVAVNTNLNSFYRYSGVTLLQSFVLRTAACALSLQCLWGKYVYASSYPIDYAIFSSVDTSHMEASFVPLVQSHNFEMVLSNPMLSRVEKTEIVRRSPYSYQYLDVCWANQTAYEIWHNYTFLEGKVKRNCGWCDKCLRTLLTLEILSWKEKNNINAYKDIFDINRYYKNKDSFIKKVFKEQDSNLFYKEIVDLILTTNYPIPRQITRILLFKEWKKKVYNFSSSISFMALRPFKILIRSLKRL